MSLHEETMLLLMAYADGELDDAERARAELLLGESEDARLFVKNLGVLGEAITAAEEQRAARLSVDSVADEVLARIAAETAPADGAKVVRLDERRAPSRVKAATMVAAVLVLAAGWALAIRTLSDAGPSAEAPAPSAPPLAVAAADEDPSGVEVENVESDESAVSLFYLPAVAGARLNAASSVVVWITDPAPQGDL